MFLPASPLSFFEKNKPKNNPTWRDMIAPGCVGHPTPPPTLCLLKLSQAWRSPGKIGLVWKRASYLTSKLAWNGSKASCFHKVQSIISCFVSIWPVCVCGIFAPREAILNKTRDKCSKHEQKKHHDPVRMVRGSQWGGKKGVVVQTRGYCQRERQCDIITWLVWLYLLH